MYNTVEKRDFLKERLSKKRFNHCVNVAEECVYLAKLYGEDEDKAYLAGLLHDICKEEDNDIQHDMAEKSGLSVMQEELDSRPLWHSIAGAAYVRDEFGIMDADIINAIRFHTVGRSGMSRLEEIVYLADLVSADRDYKDVDKMRNLAHTDLNSAMLEGFRFSIESVLKKGGYIPKYTLEGYNFYTRLVKSMGSKK